MSDESKMYAKKEAVQNCIVNLIPLIQSTLRRRSWPKNTVGTVGMQ